MLRSEIAAKDSEAKRMIAQTRSKVHELLKSRPDEVLSLSDICSALYPNWGKMRHSDQSPIIEHVVSALFAMIREDVVEKMSLAGSSEAYYGIKS